MARRDPATAGLWPRAAALLARQALEQTLDEFWDRRAPGMRRVTRWAQLACLGDFLNDSALAGEIAYTWAALSHACHHHAYDLAPTATELRAHLDTVARVISQLQRGRPTE